MRGGSRALDEKMPLTNFWVIKWRTDETWLHRNSSGDPSRLVTLRTAFARIHRIACTRTASMMSGRHHWRKATGDLLKPKPHPGHSSLCSLHLQFVLSTLTGASFNGDLLGRAVGIWKMGLERFGGPNNRKYRPDLQSPSITHLFVVVDCRSQASRSLWCHRGTFGKGKKNAPRRPKKMSQVCSFVLFALCCVNLAESVCLYPLSQRPSPSISLRGSRRARGENHR